MIDHDLIRHLTVMGSIPGALNVPTKRERERAASAPGGLAWRAQVTHCPKGHPYDDENTSWTRRPEGGLNRRCLACGRERARRRRSPDPAPLDTP